jgi:3-deoxy-D-manno-octulosonate 8-phosphate phosphatase (KDO 8-P phosphatase)
MIPDSLPKVIVCDCDGVLTDGKLNIGHDGEKVFKSFHSKDVRAIREIIANGFRFVIATADDGKINASFANKVGAEIVAIRNKAGICEAIKTRNFWAIGDDTWDLPMLKLAPRNFCPSNADPVILSYPGIRKLGPGGSGVIADLVTIMASEGIIR